MRYCCALYRVHESGYRFTEHGETGGTILGETQRSQKTLLFYADFFKAEKNLPVQLQRSLIDIIIVHELLHAFNDDNSIVNANLSKLGWDVTANANVDGFKIQDLDGITNIWIQNSEHMLPVTPTLKLRIKKYIEGVS